MTEALFCLAMAIYFEARGEPMVGQVAVAQVVINRVTDYRYPDDVCAVVKEGYYYSWDKNKPIKDKCQFSFFCDVKPETINDLTAWGFALDIAQATMEGYLYDTTSGSTHYHAYYVTPHWAKYFTRTVRINDHIFYRREFE